MSSMASAAALSRYEEPDVLDRRSCENCGDTGAGLMRCSRCHAAWFCSLACHRSYWPMHKAACRRNEFADAVELSEPKFAAWMRGHGKLAVLQDEEVERLERSSRPGGWRGLGRGEVMGAMYGRLDPSPAPPAYDTGSLSLATLQPHHTSNSSLSPADRAWMQLEVPEGLGLAATRHKWRQNLSHVEVFVRLPATVNPKQVSVQLGTRSLSVAAAGDVVLSGQLAAEVKVEDSTWFIDDGVVHLQLLKRNRKGCYANGCTAADTFWFSLLAGAKGADRLALHHPPTHYYEQTCEGGSGGV